MDKWVDVEARYNSKLTIEVGPTKGLDVQVASVQAIVGCGELDVNPEKGSS